MEKIKQFLESEKGKTILTIIVIILVGTGSFELGRLSKGSSGSGVKIEYPSPSLNQSANALSTTESPENIPASNSTPNFTNKPQKTQSYTPAPTTYFASKRGHKYYTLGCSAGKSIKQENRIYFGTSADAEKAGYTLSVGCK